MQTFNFAPFYRSTVGFDRLFSTLDQLVGMDGPAPSYPPYNIERTGENAEAQQRQKRSGPRHVDAEARHHRR